MLPLQTKMLPIKRSIDHVRQIQVAYDDTFVLMVERKNKSRDVVHINRKGDEMLSRNFYNISSFTMLYPDEVIIPEIKENKITVMKLRSKKILSFAYIYGSPQIYVFSFCHSKLICFASRISISYFEAPFPLKQNLAPIQPAAIQKMQGKRQVMMKLNNRSLVSYSCLNNNQALQIDLVDVLKIEGNHSIRLRSVKISLFGMIKKFSLSEMWEIQPNQLIIFPDFRKDKALLVNLTEDFIRQIKLDPHFQKFNMQRLMLTSEMIVSPLDTLEKSKGQNSKFQFLFFASLKSLTIDAILRFPKCYWVNQYRTLHICEYDETLLIELFNEDSELNLVMRKFLRVKEHQMHWLLHVNEDFDDDLLQDVFELL